jgi:hypothetical protein
LLRRIIPTDAHIENNEHDPILGGHRGRL